MKFKQPVKPIEIKKTSKQRRPDLEIIDLDLYEPRFMTREELIKYNVQPDFNAAGYFKQLEQNEDLDKDEYAKHAFIETYFSDDDTYDCHSYENTIDQFVFYIDDVDLAAYGADPKNRKEKNLYHNAFTSIVASQLVVCAALYAQEYGISEYVIKCSDHEKDQNPRVELLVIK